MTLVRWDPFRAWMHRQQPLPSGTEGQFNLKQGNVAELNRLMNSELPISTKEGVPRVLP